MLPATSAAAPGRQAHASRPVLAEPLIGRYQFDHVARDGASLFIELPTGIDSCRLSAVAAQDIFATLSPHDRKGLESSITAVYAAHGGMGPLVQPFAAQALRPYRREQ